MVTEPLIRVNHVPMPAFRSYVAIGDSFTEGMGDLHPAGPLAGVERGWADLVAEGLSAANGAPIGYANLAIRGRKLAPLIDEQLDPAIAQHPALISLNGGGNDILRPRMDVDRVADLLVGAARRIADAGIHVLLLAGPDPSEHLPMGRVFRARGRVLTQAVLDRSQELPAGTVTFCDNFNDATLYDANFWSRDGLHLGIRGHHKVAQNVLAALGVPSPTAWDEVVATPVPQADYGSSAYWREYVLPWIGRRLTGRSSGDGRSPKRPELEPVALP